MFFLCTLKNRTDMKIYLYKIIVIALFFAVIAPLFMSSCASLVNQPHKYITIHTTEPSIIIHKEDTINTIDNKAHLKVERKREPLSIVATTDSLTKSIRIRHRSSVMYWSNICFNFGIGMITIYNIRRTH